jgi:neutral ceramidase
VTSSTAERWTARVHHAVGLGLGLSLLYLSVGQMTGGELRVGAAAVRITPPVGMPMAGYFYDRAAEGVHDDLQAKALVFSLDGAKATMIACDMESIPRPIIEEARRLIEQSTGIAASRIMISATHAHTGPLMPGRNRASNPGGEMGRIAHRYAAGLPALIAESAQRANAALRPATLSAGKGSEPALTFNRRFFMTDGTVGWNPGKLNPKIVKPVGPIDPEVAVAYVETADNKPLATYVNYAMHLDTVGGTSFSADYPYTLAQILGKVKGPEMLTMFTIACAGDLNHLNVKIKDPQQGNAEAARIGTVLAGEVLKVYTRLQAVVPSTLSVRSQVVKLPLAPVSPEELPKAQAVAAKYGTAEYGKEDKVSFLDVVRAFKVIDVLSHNGMPIEAEVQVIALGDQVAWVSLPGEIFNELGTAIKKASPFPNTILVEQANDSIGYVPTRAAYAQGNYEAVTTRCAAGSGEMLVDAAVRLLQASYPQEPRR